MRAAIGKRAGLMFVTPAMLLIIAVMILPLFYTFYLSLHNVDFMQLGSFLGLKNYKQVLTSPGNWMAIGRTLLVTVSATAISVVLGIVLALWVDAQKNAKYAYAIQIVSLIPWVTSMVVGALLWKWILDGELGLANYLLSLFGQKPVLFLQTYAMQSLIFVVAWRTIGYSLVMVLAGLKGFSKDYIEAAQVDGATPLQILLRIKLPILKTPIAVSMIVLSMSNFNNNIVPMTLTSGGPGETTTVISLTLYRMGFTHYTFGTASALAMILFAINAIMILIYIRVIKYEI